MNYLAHARLSFGDPGIVVGNLISDFVKGKKRFDYPLNVQKGISLHRLIDEFTDRHPVTHTAKEIFRPAYRLYCGAVLDVIYDHFLAIDEREFPGTSLFDFSQTVYTAVEEYYPVLPRDFHRMFPYMKHQNWLYHYREKKGIEQSLAGLIRRAAYLTDSRPAYQLFESHYQLLGDYYRQFWTDIRSFARQHYEAMK